MKDRILKEVMELRKVFTGRFAITLGHLFLILASVELMTTGADNLLVIFYPVDTIKSWEYWAAVTFIGLCCLVAFCYILAILNKDKIKK